jgi:hypothetical protein
VYSVLSLKLFLKMSENTTEINGRGGKYNLDDFDSMPLLLSLIIRGEDLVLEQRPSPF